MATWETAIGGVKPHYTYSITYKPPRTLVHRFEDGFEHRVKKGANWVREYVEKYSTTRATMKLMLAFFKTYGFDQSFSKIAWDPYEIDDTVTAEARFIKEPKVDQVANGVYHTTFTFSEVLTAPP